MNLSELSLFFKNVEQAEITDHYLFEVTQSFTTLQQQLTEQTEKIEHLETNIIKQQQEIILNYQKEKFEILEAKMVIQYQEILNILKPKELIVRDHSGVWVDNDTGLMWSRISIGQIWENQECYGEAKQVKWKKAKKSCKKFDLAGFNDWRLPTEEELLQLEYLYKESFVEDIFYNSECGKNISDSYWSSTLDKDQSSNGYGLYYYVMNFSNRYLESEENNSWNYVRPVRDI